MRRTGTCSGRFGVALASCLVLLATAPAAAQWHRVDSPNFVVIGEADARSLDEIARKFEGFRETLTRLLSERATATAVPTVVVVFSSDGAFTPFKPQYRGKVIALGGLFVPGTDVNYIAIAGGGSNGAGLRMVFHEYAHLVFANAVPRMPVWLNEGLAEYYSTFELGRDGTQATIGRPIGDHLEMLKRGPRFRLEALLRIDHGSPAYNEGNRRSIFYAQSWALTHLILHGEPRRTHLLQAYLQTLSAGVPALDAWQRTFGGENMDRELVSYLRRNVFKAHRFTFPDTLATVEPTARPLAAPDAEAFLADLLLQQDRIDEAADRLGTLPHAAAPTPWVSTVAALLDIAQRDFASAERRLSALDAGADWLTSYRAGVGLSRLVAENGRPPADAQVAAVRRLFAAARAGRSEMPHAVASLASVELEQSGPPPFEMRSAVERATRAAPGRHDYVLLQARILARQAAFEGARLVLAPLMSPAYARHVRDAARRLMGQIVQMEAASEGDERPSATCCPPARLTHGSARIDHDVPEVVTYAAVRTPGGQETVCER